MPIEKKPHPRHAPKREIVKQIWKAGTMLAPVPVVMVTCQGKDSLPDIVTVAWAGTVCSEPPMLSISLRESRHSYGLIMESREFVVNVPTARQIRMTDYCGMVSGRDVDKFEKTGLTPGPASAVRPPIIMECPINLECAVQQVLNLGEHTMFIAEILAVQVSEHLVKPGGRLAIEDAGLAAFVHGAYHVIGKRLGTFGYSVKKK